MLRRQRSPGVVGDRRVRMLKLVQQSIAPSTRRSYVQAWLEFLNSGAVKRKGGVEGCGRRREDAVHFIMEQIEMGLSAVTISGLWDYADTNIPTAFTKQQSTPLEAALIRAQQLVFSGYLHNEEIKGGRVKATQISCSPMQAEARNCFQ
ncbi:hypothetical protein NDU88_003595 [Pleurodeles waltl]|uniref:Uncharacterized protein n=1 Tax=Pleurodeles waltl TaxID=8319 RepID=A0AAV7W7Z1_PLEWA|nr:hypothetical protein NDU88_003595 [Pleurodeles waltl]